LSAALIQKNEHQKGLEQDFHTEIVLHDLIYGVKQLRGCEI